MNYCVHYLLQRPTDTAPVRHVINDVPGTSPEQAIDSARKFVEEQGHRYIETLRVVNTAD